MAYSGGTDSAYLAWAAQRALGENAIAITADSASIPASHKRDAEAFAKECRLTTIKLKNFRSKWVGATEGNLEKILGVIQAIGQVVVMDPRAYEAWLAGEKSGASSVATGVELFATKSCNTCHRPDSSAPA